MKIIGNFDGSLADITSVVAGTGLSGGGTTGAVTLNVDAAQTQITSLGTIGTGVWQGTVVASAYLDADTAHLSGSQTFTGTKTLNSFKGTGGATVTNILDEDAMDSNSATALATQQSIKAYTDRKVSSDAQRQLTHHMFKDDIDTTKHYVGLQEADAEQTATSNKNLPLLAPVAGKLLKVFLRANSDISTKTLTWRLETTATSAPTFSSPSIIGTQSGAGCTGSSMTTYDFTSVDSNAISAGDQVLLSIQSDSTTGDHTYLVTCLWEWDLS